MDMRKELMNKKRAAKIKSAKADSLSADSGWWIFFKTAYFGKNFINLNGRACRYEWWIITLMSFLWLFVLSFIYSAVAIFYFNFSLETADEHELNSFMYGAYLINIIVSVPSMTVSFRRFHDLNMSAWWGAAVLPNLLLPFVKGKEEDNRFGKNIYR